MKGKCGPQKRIRYTDSERLFCARHALKLIRERALDMGLLSDWKQIDLVAPSVKMEGKKSVGVNAHNLWKWTRPDMLAELENRCKQDPSELNVDGKHKGGRGKKKAGQLLTSRTEYGCWFPVLEARLDARIEEVRAKRIRVSTNDIFLWMTALVEEARQADLEDGQLEEETRKANWKNSPGWLRGFLKR